MEADVVAVDLDREGRGTPSASVESEVHASLGHVVEVVDLAVARGAQALGRTRATIGPHVALRGAAQDRDRERPVVDRDSLADPDRPRPK